MTESASQTRGRRVDVRERAALPALAPVFEKQDLEYVGKSVARVDAPGKVTGAARYADDLRVEGALIGRVLRTAYPHAVVCRIDTSRAKAVPGVVAVLTHEDVPGRKAFGAIEKDQPLLVADRTRYWGDAIAMVAAESDEAARRAIEAIEVDYEPLPVLEDPLAAAQPGAPAIHGESNLAINYKVRKGDADAGFRGADVVVERVYRTPFVDTAPVEPMAVLAVPDADGGLTLHCATQQPFSVQREVAAVVGINPAVLRLDFATMGGGFGGKEDVTVDASCRAGLLALKTGRPVRVVYSREEHTRVAPKRHPMTMYCRTGATRDGRLIAGQVTIYADVGAYYSISPGVCLKAVTHAVGPYVIPNVRADLYGVYTNNPPTGAMRGFGAPQVAFAFEQQMDELAERLRMDPVELRLRNALDAGDATATSQIVDYSVGLKETIERVAERSGFRKRWRGWQADPAPGRVARGIGIATSYFGFGMRYGREAGTAVIRGREDGRVEVDTGVCELGQGALTVLSQIAAEALDVPIEDVVVLEPDTGRSPEHGTTAASLGTNLGGNGVLMAGQEARRVLHEHAAARLRVTPGAAAWRRGIVTADGRSVDVRDLVREFWQKGEPVLARTRWVPPEHVFDAEKGQGAPWFVFGFATAVAEVAVDRETGAVIVEKVTMAEDVGRAINPRNVTGQIEGGIQMALGYALMEEQRWAGGRSDAINLHNYTMPTARDMPEVEVILVEDPSPYGPFGAKGVGEPSVCPIAPAVANAVYNAVGVRLRELPITGEKVLGALRGG